LTAHAVLLGNGTVDVKPIAALGTAGQVLTSGGAGVDPAWATPAAAGGTVTHTVGALTDHAVVVGNASDDLQVLSSLGTATTLLHGNASGDPTWGAVDLAADVTGSLPQSAVASLVSDLALKAPLASAALTGTPSAPTQTTGDNSTKLATTAFVAAAVGTASYALPSLGSFAWINQGTAAIDTLTTGYTMTAPVGASTNWRLQTLAAPATPYTLTTVLRMSALMANFHQVAIGWRQSSDGKLVTFGPQCNTSTASYGMHLGVHKYTAAAGSFSASYVSALPTRLSTAPFWLRISDDGTNRKCWISADGTHWQLVHTVGRTDYLTADQILWGVDVENATYEGLATLLSWAVT